MIDFEKIGFTKGESRVLMALFKVGTSSSGALIKESKISSSKIYEVLDKLKEKGLVTEFMQNKIRHFHICSLGSIINYIKRRENELEKQKDELERSLPSLLRIAQPLEQETYSYVGMNGVRALYEEILSVLETKDEYLAFGIGEEEINNKEIRLFIRKFHLKRAERKIKARIIMSTSSRKKMKYFSDLHHYEFRFSQLKTPTSLAIYKNSIVLLDLVGDNPMAFVITSPKIAQRYRTYFEEIWKKSKR